MKQIPRKLFPIAIPLFLTTLAFANAQPPSQKESIGICIQDRCIQAEVAGNFIEREKGLMSKDSLADDSGMLFIFEEEELHSFWMKNMAFPLDILWLDSNKKITYIKENAQPCKESCESLLPGAKAKYVLEVPAGFVERNKIEVGQVARF